MAKSQPERRFPLLYDKICRVDVLTEAWRRVAANKGAAGVDGETIAAVRADGEEQFVESLRDELVTGRYRAAAVRRTHIPKPGQPGRTRPLGIPPVKDRVVQMAAKMVLEPLFEADFHPCSYGYRPNRTPRMALNAIVSGVTAGHHHVVDVDLASFFDTIDHGLLMRLVERRVADVRVLRLIRAWLRAGIMEDGTVRHPVRGTPQGGVISPLLSNIFLHEVDRQWQGGPVLLIRYADDMVLLARTKREAEAAWERLRTQFAALDLVVNEDKSRRTTARGGFRFLGFEFRTRRGRLYLWPCAKAVVHLGAQVRRAVRSIPSSGTLSAVVTRLNPILNGWCTYFRVGNSNRAFHKIDWMVRSQVQLWLRRKHRIPWPTAKRRWPYRALHQQAKLYRMVGRVSHLEALG